MGFSFCGQASIQADQCLVPAEGGRQRRREQGAAQAAAATGYVAISLVLAAVVVEWSKTGQGCGFLPGDATELGHADQERQRGALADTGNAEHQFKTPGEIAMGTKTPGKVAYLRDPAFLQPPDVAVNNAPQLHLIDMLEPGLEADDVLLELFEEGQILRQFSQSWIRRDPRLIERCRAGCDQHRIEPVGLGPPQMRPAKRFDLDRLQPPHPEDATAQMLHHAAFVPARRLDTDAPPAGPGQVGCTRSPAGQRVADLPAFGPMVNRDVEPGFGCIDSCRGYVN